MLFASIDWSKLVTAESLATFLRVAMLVVVGFPLFFFISAFAGKAAKKKLTPQASMLLRKGIFYTGSIFIIISILYQLGFKLTALLGAAGIAGIAIGFAAQTSVSNIISGLFLISESSSSPASALLAITAASSTSSGFSAMTSPLDVTPMEWPALPTL